MNPKYEFLPNQWKQVNSQPRLKMESDDDQNSGLGLRSKVFARLGDAMITGGIWLKKSSKSQIDDRSVAF